MKHLSKETKYLLMIGMLYLAGTNIAMTFVNVYLIRLTNNIGFIIIQNIFNYTALLSAFIGGTQLIHKLDLKVILDIGIISTCLYYLSILMLQKEASLLLIPLGIFNGIGQGFYYFSFNLLTGKLVKENEQGRFFSYQQSFSYIFGVITPSISGVIIARFTTLKGYYILFSFAVLLFILGMVISRNMSSFSENKNIRMIEALKVKHNKYWNTLKYYSFSNGIRESIYNQIFTVFAYAIINNEQIIGNCNSLMAFIGIFSSICIASQFNRNNQKNYHLIASIIYFVICLLLGTTRSFIMLVIFYVLMGFIYCWNNTIYQSMKYQLSNASATILSPYEFITASEFPIALGRITGLSFALILCQLMTPINAYGLLMIIGGSIWLIDHVVINKEVKWLEGENNGTL
ncbi:MAG: MFS transporter [Erysipelotrichaceae bacterium]|nr:MFS transporter [Erysipelotrichaceae bacterium]